MKKKKSKVLITCFEPYGVKGLMFRRNESKEIALRLQQKYRFEIIILPVRAICKQRLINKIYEYKPKIVICLGQSDFGFRVEGACYRENKMLYSKFAQEIKDGLKGFVKDNIGNWYCNDIYYEALSRVQKTVFIHIPIYTKFGRVDRIVRYIIKKEKL